MIIIKNIFKDKLSISSNNKFSFKLNKKMKFSDIKFQSKISLEEFNIQMIYLKDFFQDIKKI